jgi:cell division protein FtsB
MEKETKPVKELIVEQVEELQGLKYSVTRLANEIETLTKAIIELTAVNQLFMAKLLDVAIPVVKGNLEPKSTHWKEVSK